MGDLRRGGLVCMVILCLISFIQAMGSYALGNMGLLLYLDELGSSVEDDSPSLTRLESWFRQAIALHPRNLGAHRGLGFVHWREGNDSQALAEWRHIGMTVDDFVRFGNYAGSAVESLRWYGLAEQLDVTNPELWLHVGQICQRDPSVEGICPRFLAHNGGNWLVDPIFAFDRQVWRFNRREGADYAITDCPDLPHERCAWVRIGEVTSPHGTGWYQCLALEAGAKYCFSAWAKVETPGQWIPIYFQGDIDGVPKGYKLGRTQAGPQDWKYWEQEFIAPEFDADWACFHPARLLGEGQIWFHSAELRMMERGECE